nr:hypothetical protein [Tanacetum cinerariifolium]
VGPNPGEQDEGQVEPNPGDAATSQPQSNEGFTATAYPKEYVNLKLTIEEHLILEEPASSTGTLSSLYHLAKDLSFVANKTTTTTKTHLPPPQPQQSSTDSMLMKRISKLEHIMVNLIQDNKHLEERDSPEVDMKEILHQKMWETNSYKTLEDHMMLYEALEKSMNRDNTKELLKDLAKARKKKKKRRDSPKMPPRSPPHQPPPPP